MESYTLASEVDVRRELAGRTLSLHVLRPEYAAVGIGRLRVLRISERADGALVLLTSYERYERAFEAPRRAAPAPATDEPA